MAGKTVLPRVHVMVLCDDVEEHADEPGVYNLLGARTAIHVALLPTTYSRLLVYMQVTGHEGVAELELVLVRAETDEPVARSTAFAVDFFGPLVPIPLAVEVPDCWFPEEGVYYLQAYSGTKLLGERLLLVEQRLEETNGQAG